MPEYRRTYVQGGTIFLTLVTYQRHPIFINPENIAQLRYSLTTVRSEMPFEIDGAVVLPDHIHFIWTLPIDDQNYSKRIGRLKVLFTRSLGGKTTLPENLSMSRRKHRESNVWQRRFWEHTIRNEADFENHLNYIHYNPVKHGLVSCPHLWLYSSFHKFVRKGMYAESWCCSCSGEKMKVPSFEGIVDNVGE
jgi:putative transposase